MAADSTHASPESMPPKSLGSGLELVRYGVWLAAIDGVAATVVTVRLLTFTFDDSKLGELWVLAGVRAFVYLAAIAGALVLRRRSQQGRDGARVGLIALLCFFAIGGVANLVFGWIELLGAAMGGEYARPLEPWVNYLGLASLGLDVVLIVLALIAAVMLLVGARGTKSAVDSRP